MNRHLSCMIVLSLFGYLTAMAAAEDAVPGIRWGTNAIEGCIEARANQIPLVIYFQRETLGETMPLREAIEAIQCRSLERDVFQRREFQDLADRAVFVRLSVADLDPNGLGAKIYRETELNRAPALVVMKITDEILHLRGGIRGTAKPDLYLRYFAHLLENATDLSPKRIPNIPDVNDPYGSSTSKPELPTPSPRAPI